jgi:hypothetical protein
VTRPDDDFDPAAFQAFCARHGIEATPYTDAFGRTDFRLDRQADEKRDRQKQLADRNREQR